MLVYITHERCQTNGYFLNFTTKAEWSHLGNMYKFEYQGKIFGEYMLKCEIPYRNETIDSFNVSCLKPGLSQSNFDDPMFADLSREP